MFRNYMKIALRNLVREKGYAIINIAGLTTGIASCILILLFITNELTYDRHHENADRIYRVGVEARFGDSHFFSALTSGAMKDALDYEFSELEQSTRLSYLSRPVVRIGDRNLLRIISSLQTQIFSTFSRCRLFQEILLRLLPGQIQWS
jgi:putative ABC transport system permease protein